MLRLLLPWPPLLTTACNPPFLQRTSLYGEGTYLATDLSVALNFSKTGVCPSQCRLAGTMTCLAVGEVVNHPSVKRPGDEASNPQTSSLSGRVVIPEKCKW